MLNLQAHILRFVVEATTTIHLREHKGSTIRGAFFHALRSSFCTFPSSRSCKDCSLWTTCPVCYLVATLDEGADRGQDIPRPYVIRPPLDSRVVYRPADRLEFGITLFSRALNLFPYVIVAVNRMGEAGLGRDRGRFRPREVWTENPLTGVQHRLYQTGNALISVPDIPVTHAQIIGKTENREKGVGNRDKGEGNREKGVGNGKEVALHFRTPLRLTAGGELMHRLSFATLVRRLLERLSALSRAYAAEDLSIPFQDLLRQAESVEIVADATRWVEVGRYSSRQSRQLPMGGLMGKVVLRGDLAPLLPWLIWGSLAHVGKYAVLGNGWYDLEAGL